MMLIDYSSDFVYSMAKQSFRWKQVIHTRKLMRLVTAAISCKHRPCVWSIFYIALFTHRQLLALFSGSCKTEPLADSHVSWVTCTLWEECTDIVLCDRTNRTGRTPANKQTNTNNWFKDTVILQEDFLQFGKVIHSFQIFYGVVISLQDLQAWKQFNFQKKKQTMLIFLKEHSPCRTYNWIWTGALSPPGTATWWTEEAAAAADWTTDWYG